MAKKIKTAVPVKKDDNLQWLENIVEYIKEKKILFTIIFLVIFVAAIGGAVYSQMKNNEVEESNKLYDFAIAQINQVGDIQDPAQQQQVYQQEVAALDQLIQTYPKTVAAERARLFMGKLYYSQAFSSENSQAVTGAMQYYKDARDFAKSDFFRALGTIGLAYCYEQQMNYALAFSSFQEVTVKYPKEGFNPLCLIGMARAKELVQDYNGALTYYKQLLSDYPDSTWTKFARGKVYYFTSGAGSSVPTSSVSSLPALPSASGPVLP